MRHILTLAVAGLALGACESGGSETEHDNTDTNTEEVADRTATEGESDTQTTPAGEDGTETPQSGEFADGQWFTKTERGVEMALYGPPQTEASFLVRCEGNELALIRSVPIDGQEADMMLRAGGETRTLSARPRPGPLAQTTALLPASDPFAGVLARTTEPITVTIGDGAAFRVPSHEYLREVAANCRA